jgi:hypothetical protein
MPTNHREVNTGLVMQGALNRCEYDRPAIPFHHPIE